MKSIFPDLGIAIPEVLIPRDGISLQKWAVIACDQFTSEPEYWEDLDRYVSDSPSALRMVLPECYLGRADTDARVSSIHETMRRYLQDGTMRSAGPGFVLVLRDTPFVHGRAGLLVAIDLESYDYSAGSRSLVRATEGTIVDRLPPRIRVRQGAPVELPHILVLLDDPDRTVIEPLVARRSELTELYDTELNAGGGRVSGFLVSEPGTLNAIHAALTRLADPGKFSSRYGSQDVLLYAAGDGNHSLAAAKSFWERRKADGAGSADPARYALVELVNVHSEQLPFEPIHRVLTNADASDLTHFLINACSLSVRNDAREGAGPNGGSVANESDEYGGRDVVATILSNNQPPLRLRRSPSDGGALERSGQSALLPVAVVQKALDDYLTRNPGIGIDYIHGRAAVERLAAGGRRVGILLPPIEKRLLFPTVIRNGALPRKAFSLGEAQEKRYYLEARKLVP